MMVGGVATGSALGGWRGSISKFERAGLRRDDRPSVGRCLGWSMPQVLPSAVGKSTAYSRKPLWRRASPRSTVFVVLNPRVMDLIPAGGLPREPTNLAEKSLFGKDQRKLIAFFEEAVCSGMRPKDVPPTTLLFVPSRKGPAVVGSPRGSGGFGPAGIRDRLVSSTSVWIGGWIVGALLCGGPLVFVGALVLLGRGAERGSPTASRPSPGAIVRAIGDRDRPPSQRSFRWPWGPIHAADPRQSPRCSRQRRSSRRFDQAGGPRGPQSERGRGSS